jgi:hypothetical protein
MSSLFNFVDTLLGRVFIWASRTRNVVFDLVSSDCIHKSSFRSRLNRSTVKSEMFQGTVIVDKLRQSIADVVTIDLLNRV